MRGTWLARPMRRSALVMATLTALMLAAPVHAQDGMSFPETHQIRLAYGDIPSTDATEPAGSWNGHETRQVSVADGDRSFPLPDGATEPRLEDDSIHFNATFTDGAFQITWDDQADGVVTFTITYKLPGSPDHFAFEARGSDKRVFLYAAQDTFVHAASTASTLPSATVPGITIYDFESTPDRFWLTVAPSAVMVEDEDGFDFLGIIIGLLIGAALWALLVQRGIVQKRSRRQVAATSAHVAAASTESKATLETRKRLLMAALKELEMAKMNKDVEPATYDALKAEFKKQTVTVMRALEEA